MTAERRELRARARATEIAWVKSRTGGHTPRPQKQEHLDFTDDGPEAERRDSASQGSEI